MKDLSKTISSLKNINSSIDRIVLAVVDSMSEYVLNLNKNQLKRGLTEKGNPIRPKYTVSYSRYKRGRGKPVDRVNLKLEGDFYEGFYIEVGPDYFEIKSSDDKEKVSRLVKKYSGMGDIFGLTPKSIAKMNNKIKPMVLKKIKELINV